MKTILFSLSILITACSSVPDLPDYEKPLPELLDTPEQCFPISTERPVYPANALQSDVEGWVYLIYDLDGSGKAKNIRLFDQSPSNVFGNSAALALGNFGFDMTALENNCAYLFQFGLH